MRRLLIPLLALGLAACAEFRLVPPGETRVGKGLTVTTPFAWNRMRNPMVEGDGVELWTIDGPSLNQLIFVTGIAEGEPLFLRRDRSRREEVPAKFRATMTPIEIRELFEQSVARVLRSALISSRDLAPVQLGNGAGYRFETSFTDADEVDQEGVVYFTVRAGKLYLAWFQGTRLHHYERYREQVERMLRDLRV